MGPESVPSCDPELQKPSEGGLELHCWRPPPALIVTGTDPRKKAVSAVRDERAATGSWTVPSVSNEHVWSCRRFMHVQQVKHLAFCFLDLCSACFHLVPPLSRPTSTRRWGGSGWFGGLGPPDR